MRANRLRALAATTLGALAAAAAAQGAGGLEVRTVDAAAYPLVRVTLVAPPGAEGTPTLKENGAAVVGLAAENLGRAKSIALLLDRSQSMRGGALEDAVAAARQFVRLKRPGDRISVLSFGSRATQLTGFSTSPLDADGVLAGLTVDPRQGTALHDAIALAARSLGGEAHAGRVIVVLTDGTDVSSTTSLAEATAEARVAGAAVYAIGIEGTDFAPAALRRLADTTGGSYRGVSGTDELMAVYTAITRELSRTWRLEYTTAARPGDRLAVETAFAGSAASGAGVAPGAAAAPEGGPSPLLPAFVYDHGLGALLVTLAVGGLAFLAVVLVLALPAGASLRRRLDPHTGASGRRRRREPATPRERFAGANAVLASTEKAFQHLSLWRRAHRLIERADLPLRTVEFVYIAGGSGLMLGVLTAATGASSIAILLAMAAGAWIPVTWAWWKARKRMNAFENQLPDLLIGLAASLKAGHSFRQGIQAVVEEGHPPASDEFKRVLTETRLGRSMDDALAEMAERVGSKNLTFVITAVTIQRQVGGSLAGIFDMVAEAVRQRQQFARKIRSLTAMGRMSAYVLLGLPFFLAGAITVVNPEYIDPLYSTSAGHKLVVGGLMMMAVGSLMLRKIVSFKG